MKILHIISTWKGGVIRVAFDVGKALNHRSHNITIYALDLINENKDLDKNGIDNIHTFPVLYQSLVIKNRVYITPRMISSIKNIKSFEIIHLHEYRTFQNILIHHYARKFDIPYVLQPHGSLSKGKNMQKLKWTYDVLFGYKLLRDASMIIALNQNEAQQCRDMGIPKKKIEVIPNGIDPTEYIDLPSSGSFRKKFGIPEDKRIVLYLGRIHRIKGVDILVRAFAVLADELNDVILVIVGPDDGYLDGLLKLVNDLDVKKRVVVTGPLYGIDKLEAYVDADVYVLPSRYEAFSMSVLEAYSCGKPVIASRVGGLKDLVINNVTGLLFTPEDTVMLTESIYTILNDITKAKEMGNKGKEYVKENFTVESFVDKLEELYIRAIE